MFFAMASSCESSAWCVSLKFPAWPELNASSGASVGVSREFCATSLFGPSIRVSTLSWSKRRHGASPSHPPLLSLFRLGVFLPGPLPPHPGWRGRALSKPPANEAKASFFSHGTSVEDFCARPTHPGRWTSLAPRWAPWCGATTRPRRGDWMRRGGAHQFLAGLGEKEGLWWYKLVMYGVCADLWACFRRSTYQKRIQSRSAA